MIPMMNRLAAALAAVAGLTAVPAQAHIVADPNQGDAGTYFRTALRVGHGCKGSATTAVQVGLPPGVTVKAGAKPGWTVETDPQSITWRGGPLPDSQFAEFGLLLKLPATAQTLWFPVVQTCEQGEAAWTAIPAEGKAWGSVPMPAPFVRVRPAAATHNH
jgi:uncharacterized protein YcnI